MSTDPASLARDLHDLAQRAEQLARSLESGLAPLAKPEAVMTPEMATTKLTLTQAETAELLGVHVRTLQRLRVSNTGPKPITIGSAVRYRRRDVERWLEGKRS